MSFQLKLKYYMATLPFFGRARKHRDMGREIRQSIIFHEKRVNAKYNRLIELFDSILTKL